MTAVSDEPELLRGDAREKLAKLAAAPAGSTERNTWVRLQEGFAGEEDAILEWFCTHHPYLGCSPVQRLAMGGTISSIETATYLTFPPS